MDGAPVIWIPSSVGPCDGTTTRFSTGTRNCGLCSLDTLDTITLQMVLVVILLFWVPFDLGFNFGGSRDGSTAQQFWWHFDLFMVGVVKPSIC